MAGPELVRLISHSSARTRPPPGVSLRRSSSSPELLRNHALELKDCLVEEVGGVVEIREEHVRRRLWRSAWWGFGASPSRRSTSDVENDDSWRTLRVLRGIFRRRTSPIPRGGDRPGHSGLGAKLSGVRGEISKAVSFGNYVEKEMEEVTEEAIEQEAPYVSLRNAWQKHAFSCVQLDIYGQILRKKMTREDILDAAEECDDHLHTSLISMPTRCGRKVDSDCSRRASSKRKASRYSDLSARDIRQVDPRFSAKPALWVRRNALVVSLDHIRAIIFRNKMLIFDPDRDGMQSTIELIQEKVIEDPRANGNYFAPFEFRALEGILITVSTALDKTFYSEIQPGMYMGETESFPLEATPEFLENIRRAEQKLNQFITRSRKVKQTLQDLLDDDEDMSEMYLSEKHKNPNVQRNSIDHDEAEMLLEHYLQVVDYISNKAYLLNQASEESKGMMQIHLDQTQNRILLVDLFILILTTSMTGGTMIAGILGMNFPYPRAMGSKNQDRVTFWVVLAFIFFWVFLTSFGAYAYCRKEGILGRWMLEDPLLPLVANANGTAPLGGEAGRSTWERNILSNISTGASLPSSHGRSPESKRRENG